MKPEGPTPDDIAQLRSALLAHYDRSARALPWRRNRDPYRVLVSEVMLQQTRVETVLGYYEPWLERFPTVDALAQADEDTVLKAWEGLGYYRRARNLHRAAKVVMERDDGFPTTAEGLRALPGVGEYTAGAVASIAFEETAPAVDGNVRRVLARLYDRADPKPSWLRRRAAELVDPARPGDWNQALMELGATVCTPRRPACPTCPVTDWCAARKASTQDDRPARRERRPVPRVALALAVLEHSGRILVERRPAGGLLGGMWAFPEVRLAEAERSSEAAAGDASDVGGGPAEGSPTLDETMIRARIAVLRLADELDLVVEGSPRLLEPVGHRFSHLDATYLPVALDVADGEGGPDVDGGPDARPMRWIRPDDDETALPVAQRKVLDAWLEMRTMEDG